MSNNYNVLDIDLIRSKYIKTGKEQVFNKTRLIPIYYYEKSTGKTKYDNLIIKSPRLFVNNSFENKYNQSKNKTLEAILVENGNSKECLIAQFSKTLSKIETSIKKQLLRKYKKTPNDLSNKEYCSLVKTDKTYQSNKIYLPISYENTQLIDINSNKILLSDSSIKFPTYGYFVFMFKNVWIKDHKWGINIFCNGGMILPSQYCDPPPIPKPQLEYLFKEELDELKIIGDDSKFTRFFKMKKMGVPVQAIKNKMCLEDLTPIELEFITLDEKTSIREANRIINIRMSGQGNNNIPPPPPPPPPPFPNSLGATPSHPLASASALAPALNRINLNDILNFKFKKQSHKAINTPIQPRKPSVDGDSRVPSLDQIRDAISKMGRGNSIA